MSTSGSSALSVPIYLRATPPRAHPSRQDLYGFCLVEGIPPTPEATEALVRRIAFIRETHYGGFWDFTADLSHGDLAYSDLPLLAHTDTTYFSEVRCSHPRAPTLH